MNNDNELFELCKEVFDITFWNSIELEEFEIGGGATVPLYTSDFLLEKLPYEVSVHVAGLEVTSNGLGDSRNWLAEWASGSGKKRMNGGIAKTPRIALLKLIKALAEAGEL